MILSELRARAWQVGAFGAGAAALGMAVALGVTTLQKNAAVKRADGLHAQIHAPVTGYIASAARCKANVVALDAGLQAQTAAVTNLQKQGAQRLAEAEAAIAAAQQDAAAARYRAERLAGATIRGATTCERVENVDQQVLEMLR